MINISYLIFNNDIPIKIPSYPYVTVKSIVLCNCGIEAENNYPLESLAAYHDSNSKLVMYFIVDTAFASYLDQFTNLSESLEIPIIKNKTTFEQTLPIYLTYLNLTLIYRNLKDFIHRYNCKKENFDLNERHVITDLTTNKKTFLTTK